MSHLLGLSNYNNQNPILRNFKNNYVILGWGGVGWGGLGWAIHERCATVCHSCAQELRDGLSVSHKGRWGGKSGVLDAHGWLENDGVSILHGFIISLEIVTGNTKKMICHVLLIS